MNIDYSKLIERSLEIATGESKTSKDSEPPKAIESVEPVSLETLQEKEEIQQKNEDPTLLEELELAEESELPERETVSQMHQWHGGTKESKPEESKPEEPKPEEKPLMCSHTCACGRTWSHGRRENCKCPDIVEVSPCHECVREMVSDKDTKTANKGTGVFKIPVEKEIELRNSEQATCLHMSLEGLETHIQMLSDLTLQYRIRQLEAGKIRRDLIEEELEHIFTDEEKEAFRRKVAKLADKKTPSRQDKQRKARKTADEKAIDSMMKLGLTREAAKKVLNK